MNSKFAKRLLHMMGWKEVESVVPEKKCIILGAPHTSVWDFPVSYLYYKAVGGDASVMIKKEFFFWPLGPILRSLGGVPVVRDKGANVVRQMIKAFDSREVFHLAIAPEGTRRAVGKRWKTGFHTIAKATGVPVYLGYFDWGTKQVGRGEKFELTDDVQADMKRIRQWYKDKGVVGKHPEMFTLGDDLA